MAQNPNAPLGSPHGGGEQPERIEGSLTDGGSLPGVQGEADRSFGALRREERREPGEAPPQDDIAGALDAGAVNPDGDDLAGRTVNAEQPGYGNTPPR